jgi:small-conductance mechanosensitive channel
LLAGIFVLYVTVITTMVLRDTLYRWIAPRTGAEPGVVHSIVTIGRYAIIAIGILFALRVLGLDLSSLTIIGGGLSVGIGFGLQQIVANFISGILLLFEQSLRPGDVIEINNQLGTVEKLNVRATIVRTNDNIEMIIPNEQFLTTSVTTYTKTSRLVRISVNLGVGYDSDPHLVRQILLETAVQHELIEENPPPVVFFNAFGDSSLSFRLAVWTQHPHQIPRIRSDLFFLIWDAFKQHHITIPFPQQDLNLGRGWDKVFAPDSSPPTD